MNQDVIGVQVLEKILHEYGSIILFPVENVMYKQLKNSVVCNEASKKVLILPLESNDEFISLFHTYEFSDRISVLERSSQYGTLFNYVKTGILTEQEMVDALLYKI